VRVCELLSKKSAAANLTFEMRSLSAAVAARKPSPSESHALSDSEPADSRALLPCALLAVFGKALPICLVAAPVWNSLLIRHSHCIITHLHLGAGACRVAVIYCTSNHYQRNMDSPNRGSDICVGCRICLHHQHSHRGRNGSPHHLFHSSLVHDLYSRNSR